MNFEIIKLTIQIVSVVGGISGFISLFLFIKKFRAKIKVHPAYGSFRIDKNTKRLNSSVGLIIYNGKEEPIAITDASATIRYNAEKFRNSQEQRMAFSCKAKNLKAIPTNVGVHESAKLNLSFVFDNVNVDILDRFGTAHIMGFYQDVPMVIVDERENQLNWDKNPIMLLISLHINGDKIHKMVVPLFNMELQQEHLRGSLNAIDIARLEKDFLTNKIK